MRNLSYNLKLQEGPEGNEMGPGPVNRSPHSESHISTRIRIQMHFIYTFKNHIFVIYYNKFQIGITRGSLLSIIIYTHKYLHTYVRTCKQARKNEPKEGRKKDEKKERRKKGILL